MSDATPQVDAGIRIRAEPLVLDPATCKFTVNCPVHPGGPFFFADADAGRGSPLVERLFGIPGVATVLIADNVVTVGKVRDAGWDRLAGEVGQAIRSQLVTGVRAILENPPTARPGRRTDGEILETVQGLLDREVNPSIASHGGKIALVEVKDRVVTIAMSGGCQGCAASSLTLRQGFEVMVRRAVPEVVRIVDATDHGAGTQPFYRPG